MSILLSNIYSRTSDCCLVVGFQCSLHVLLLLVLCRQNREGQVLTFFQILKSVGKNNH